MQFFMYNSDTYERLAPQEKYALSIVGDTLDDRGAEAKEFIEKNSEELLVIRYHSSDMAMEINGEEVIDSESFKDFLIQKVDTYNSPVLIESTTLGIAELFICISALFEAKTYKIDFLYLEPWAYKRSESPHKNFELTDETQELIGIPGAAINLDDKISKGIFFLGFEDYRFNRILEERDGDKPAIKCPVVFGVPPFQAGWELHSFRVNIEVLAQNALYNEDVHFCPANNPFAAYELLSTQYEALPVHEKMFVAPLGTKPESIGVCTYVAEQSIKEDGKVIGMIYDHPKKTKGRSIKVYKWHLYQLRK